MLTYLIPENQPSILYRSLENHISDYRVAFSLKRIRSLIERRGGISPYLKSDVHVKCPTDAVLGVEKITCYLQLLKQLQKMDPELVKYMFLSFEIHN